MCFREQAEAEEEAGMGPGHCCDAKEQRAGVLQVAGSGGGKVQFSTKKEVRLSPTSSNIDTHRQGGESPRLLSLSISCFHSTRPEIFTSQGKDVPLPRQHIYTEWEVECTSFLPSSF